MSRARRRGGFRSLSMTPFMRWPGGMGAGRRSGDRRFAGAGAGAPAINGGGGRASRIRGGDL